MTMPLTAQPPMLTNTNLLTGARQLEAWRVYAAAMTPLAVLAIQRHLMTHNEFVSMCTDTRVIKYLGYDDTGRMSTVATCTNHLAAVDLISQPYFKRRWPEAFKEKRIWYCPYAVSVDPSHRLFPMLIAAMYEVMVDNGGGVFVFDSCRRNEKLSRAIAVVLKRIAAKGTAVLPADEQTYYIYETGAAT